MKIPSFYTGTTDWRNGKVDRDQRRGAIFRASFDGRVWDDATDQGDIVADRDMVPAGAGDDAALFGDVGVVTICSPLLSAAGEASIGRERDATPNVLLAIGSSVLLADDIQIATGYGRYPVA